MPGSTAQILTYSLLPTAAMAGGGAIAAWRPPGPALRSAILHFAAGVVFSVVAVELLPDVVKGHAPVQVVIGFALGVAAMLGVRGLTRRAEQAGEGGGKAASATGMPLGLLVGVGVDVAIDGLLLGIAFAAGAKEGILLTLALTVEVLSLGLATSTTLGVAGLPRVRAAGAVAALALLFFVGAAAGATLLRGLSGHALEIVLSFGLAALLFLVTEELLVEAHEEEETPWLTAAFFVGFLLFLVLGMMG